MVVRCMYRPCKASFWKAATCGPSLGLLLGETGSDVRPTGWSLAVCGSELFCGLDDHFGAVLWTSDPSAALEGPVATSIEASCHEAATKASMLVPEPVLEGAAARASNQGAAGGEVSMGGTPPPPPNPNYDFSFPVELRGRPGLQINWNRGDDPEEDPALFHMAHADGDGARTSDARAQAGPGDAGATGAVADFLQVPAAPSAASGPGAASSTQAAAHRMVSCSILVSKSKEVG